MIRFVGRPFALILFVFLAASGRAAASTPLEPALSERCLDVLREGLDSEEFWPSMHAAEALTLAGCGEEVLAALADRHADDDQHRCGLAREAVRAGDRTKLPILLEILDKPGSNGHTHAAESLFKVCEVGDGTKLRAALAQDDDIPLKLMAAAALARCGHPRALEAPRAYVTDANADLRRIAVWILGQLGDEADIASIRAQLARESDPLVRAYFQHSLALLGDAEAREALGENLSSADAVIRTYAAAFAGHCRAAEFREGLVKLLDDPTLDVRIRAAQSLIALSLPPTNDRDVIKNDVYPATEKHPRYSEGSVALLTDGTLLYATTEFTDGAEDAARAHIIARESRDGGRTWGDVRVLQKNVGERNVMSVTVRRMEPGAVGGPLGLFYLVKNGPDDLKIYLKISTDEAKTFGEPVCVTDAPGYHVMNNDRVTVLSSGRIVCPISWDDDIGGKDGSHFVCFCYFSDDGGRSWSKSSDSIDLPRRGAMEPGVIELKDGRLMMIMRTQLGQIATAISTDGGDHWGEVSQLSVEAPEAPATIRRIPATGDLLLVWNNNYKPGAGHSGKRTPLAAAVSSDEGRSWRHVRNLESDSNQAYTYTSALFVKDRVLLTYYFTDPGIEGVSSRFRSLPVSWFYESQK